MRCLITAGPTYEPLDQVRRLTNLSTGRLGAGLALAMHQWGWDVSLLLGEMAVVPPPAGVATIRFTTTANLGEHLERLASVGYDTVFHAAAVSDYAFGRIWRSDAPLEVLPTNKISTACGALVAELVPTPKLLAQLRGWFAAARIVGWKYEVEGDRDAALARGWEQLRVSRTNACVVNGPAFGPGYGVLREGHTVVVCQDPDELYAGLRRLAGAGCV